MEEDVWRKVVQKIYLIYICAVTKKGISEDEFKLIYSMDRWLASNIKLQWIRKQYNPMWGCLTQDDWDNLDPFFPELKILRVLYV